MNNNFRKDGKTGDAGHRLAYLCAGLGLPRENLIVVGPAQRRDATAKEGQSYPKGKKPSARKNKFC